MNLLNVLILSVRHRDRGQSLVEYAIILACVALLLFGLIRFYGEELNQIYNEIYNDFPDG